MTGAVDEAAARRMRMGAAEPQQVMALPPRPVLRNADIHLERVDLRKVDKFAFVALVANGDRL